MALKIGNQRAEDAASRFERLVQLTGEKAAKTVMAFGPVIVNRPVGSTPLTDDDLLADYEMMLVDPNVVTERYTSRASQVGPKMALREIVEFAQRAGKLMEKRNGGN